MEKPTTDTAEAVRWVMSYHAGPRLSDESRLLVVSWFRNDVQSLLRYSVSDRGDTHNRRTFFNSGTQDTQDATLSADQLTTLRALLEKLPESKAEPPIQQTVLVSFQSGDKWRTETYDAAALPDEFEKVLLIIGERFETKDRRKANEFNEKREAFKRKMMPSVGKVVTVTGTLSTGKIADFIATDDGGAVYIMGDIDKTIELSRLTTKRLTVTGTLQFRELVPPPQPGIAAIDEHFFMDIGTAKIRAAAVER